MSSAVFRATRILWSSRHTGTCHTWASCKRHGFITDDIGHGDIYVHARSIKESWKTYKALSPGENVEFNVVIREDGEKEAVNVTGAGGNPVEGVKRRTWPPNLTFKG